MRAGKGCLTLAALLLAGCATATPVRIERPPEVEPGPAETPVAEAPDPFRGVPGKYRELADAAEKAGDLRRALLYRKVVDGFAPDDTDARAQVARMERRIRGEIDRRYREGLALEESGEAAKALREFLAVLALDPDHEAAFRKVKGGNGGGMWEGFRSRTVREGDTLRKIAVEEYRDPDKEFLIAYFNGLAKGSPLSTGAVLRLPEVETGPPKAPGPSAHAATARDALRAGRYREAVAQAEKVLEYSPSDKEANEIRNAGYYQWGTSLARQGEHRESIRMFRKLPPGYRNAAELREVAEGKLREADAHYAAGMRSFLAEDLDGAIREWGKALSLDPSHPKARRDLEKARRLKEKAGPPK